MPFFHPKKKKLTCLIIQPATGHETDTPESLRPEGRQQQLRVTVRRYRSEQVAQILAIDQSKVPQLGRRDQQCRKSAAIGRRSWRAVEPPDKEAHHHTAHDREQRIADAPCEGSPNGEDACEIDGQAAGRCGWTGRATVKVTHFATPGTDGRCVGEGTG